ncbi:hypothetical protein BTVI_37659 [Pitangus sulphuratus]|nr:hypothetical protein BTVI_37659 [Pitangus sulphuratus]
MVSAHSLLTAVSFPLADVNECTVENGGCQDQCCNTVGSYHCKCPAGQKLEEDGKSCGGVPEGFSWDILEDQLEANLLLLHTGSVKDPPENLLTVSYAKRDSVSAKEFKNKLSWSWDGSSGGSALVVVSEEAPREQVAVEQCQEPALTEMEEVVLWTLV